jgi:hypothetical protein
MSVSLTAAWMVGEAVVSSLFCQGGEDPRSKIEMENIMAHPHSVEGAMIEGV